MSIAREELPVPAPTVGMVYRDAHDRSLMVLGIGRGRVLVEYADGAITSLRRARWPGLKPRRASF